jgi:hypothetical protein
MRPQASERHRVGSSPHSDMKDRQDSQWTEHEHITNQSATKAAELLQATGTQALAKVAIEAAADAEPDEGIQSHEETRAAFARAMGFGSFSELLHASEQTASNDGMQWYLTPLADQHWAAWNEVQLHLDRHYVSKADALASVPHEANFSGSSLLG